MDETVESSFINNLQMLIPQSKEEYRSQAWKRFLEVGLPHKGLEVYRYIHLDGLYGQTFVASDRGNYAKKAEVGNFIFVNGHYRADLSTTCDDLIALPLSEARKTYGSFLKNRLTKQLHEETDPFALLNLAFSPEGLFIYLPAGTVCRTPIHILHIVESSCQPTLLFPRIEIFIGKEASLQLHTSQEVEGKGSWINGSMDLTIEERGELDVTFLCKEAEESWRFEALRATLKRESKLTTMAITNGGKMTRHDYAIRLAGEQAEASLWGVCGLSGHRQHHVNVLMEHMEPHCHSLQKFKGVMCDHSRSSFEGKIHVHRKAQKTEAYQMNNNLLLGRHSFATSKPNLEIFADDVKASHGSTVGQIDGDQLFYLRSRGFSEGDARKLLVRGFTDEIINQIDCLALRHRALSIL